MDTADTAIVPDSQALDEQLTRLEADLKASAANNGKTEGTEDDAPLSGDRAPGADNTAGAAPDSKTPDKTDTQSDAEKAEFEAEQKLAEAEGKEVKLDDKGKPARDDKGKFIRQEKKPVEVAVVFSKEENEKFSKWLKQTQSKFGADLGKRLIRWDRIKEEEAALKKQTDDHAAKVKLAEDNLKAAQEAFKAEQQKAKRSQSPEAYEEMANAELAKHNDLLEKIKRAESDGDVEKVERLTEEAILAKGYARQARERAEHLRKNPPPDEKQEQQIFLNNQKTWIDKAVGEFPSFKDKESPVFKTAVAYFKEVCKDPAVAKLPGIIYHCVKLAAAQTAADRVPALEKELGELKTKLTDLEKLTSTTPSGGVNRMPKGNVEKTWETKSADEQFKELQEAAAMMV